MLNLLFNLVEIFAVIGLIRACINIHSVCLKYKWLRHASQVGAWTVTLMYAAGIAIVFYFAYVISAAAYLIIFGIGQGFGWTVCFAIIPILAVIGHMIAGAVWLIPHLARALAAISSKRK